MNDIFSTLKLVGLREDSEHISRLENFHRIDRVALTVGAVQPFDYLVNEIEIYPGIDTPWQMIFGYQSLQIDRIEQDTLRILLPMRCMHPF